ncbi:MAG: MlaE family ABC transporter permease [Bacillota bacterium]
MATAEMQSSRFGAIVGWTGRRTLSVGGYVLDLSLFVAHAFRDWARSGRVFNRATLQTLYGQVIFTGVDALPLVTFLGLAVGLSITSQMLKLATALGSESDVARLLTNIVGVELSSILTAIVLIGRSGSAIAVDLGSMKLRGEVEGLELLGIDVNEFFVTPRIIGAAVAQFTLAVYFALIALFGGVFLNDLLTPGSSTHQLAKLAEAIGPEQTILFMIKNLLFGVIIAGTACYHALKVRTSTTEVPQQTQRAIVTGLVLVFATDGILAIVA